jgi:molecular chaperone DnaK
MGIFFDEARKQPAFVVDLFLDLARERHIAIDKPLHDRQVADGQSRIEREDIDGLRQIIGQMLDNRYPTGARAAATLALAGLMK